MSQNALIFLVLCAIVVLFATGAMKRSAQTEQRERREALEQAAGEIGLTVLTRADALPFDGRLQTTAVRGAADLTPPPFARGGAFTAARDLDDLHEMAPREVRHTTSDEPFVLTARVEYVDEQDRVASSQTLAKRVVAVVTHPELLQPIELGRIYELVP